MLGPVVLLFVVLPFVELWLLIELAGIVGFWETLGIVVATGVLGGLLARHQGARAWRDILDAWRRGRVPHVELVAGALFLVGAAFLLTPGVITDAAGLLLMVPILRRAAARVVISRFAVHATVTVVGGPGPARGDAAREGDVSYEAPDGDGTRDL